MTLCTRGGVDIVKRKDFFALSIDVKLKLMEQWKIGEVAAPKWVEALLLSVQQTYGIRIQMAFEVMEIMCTHDLLEEQAFEELLKQMHRRQRTESTKKE